MLLHHIHCHFIIIIIIITIITIIIIILDNGLHYHRYLAVFPNPFGPAYVTKNRTPLSPLNNSQTTIFFSTEMPTYFGCTPN